MLNDTPLHQPNSCPSYNWLKMFLLPRAPIYLYFCKIVSESQISEGSCSVTISVACVPGSTEALKQILWES